LKAAIFRNAIFYSTMLSVGQSGGASIPVCMLMVCNPCRSVFIAIPLIDHNKHLSTPRRCTASG